MRNITQFKTIKEVRKELKNNCFYIYLVVSESKLRVYDIKKQNNQLKAKVQAGNIFSTNISFNWIPCELCQLAQQ